MTVVVTGAAGFIGRNLVAHLADRDHDVIAIDRRRVLAGSARVRTMRLDLLDVAAADVLRRADVVFHLAGRPGVRDSGPGVAAHRHRDNVLATAAVLAATPYDVPVVVTSSSSVYGGARGRACREDDALRPLGGYARSKALTERLCAERRAAGGAVAVVRPFTVAGEGQRPDMAIAQWVDAVRTGTPVRLLGSATRTRDVTDVRDVVRGLIAAADHGLGRTTNLGTGVGRTLAEILAAVCAAVGSPTEVVAEPAPVEEVVDTLADTTQCERVLGFRPVTDLPALVARQVAALPEPALSAVPG